MSSKGKPPSSMVRDLLARVGAPPAALETEAMPEAPPAEAPAAPQAGDARAAEARENARAAMRRAMGLPPLPVAPSVPFSGLAPKPHRSAPAASVPVWRSEVAARVRRERAGNRCECAGANAGWCGEGHAAGRCAVREGDTIPGPRDFPGEARRAVLVAERLDRSAPSRDPANMIIRCPACSDAVARNALRASAPVRAGGHGARAAASGRGAIAGGDDADVFAD